MVTIDISFSRLKYVSVFDTTDDGQSETEMTMNVTPRYVLLSHTIK